MTCTQEVSVVGQSEKDHACFRMLGPWRCAAGSGFHIGGLESYPVGVLTRVQSPGLAVSSPVVSTFVEENRNSLLGRCAQGSH